MDAYILKAALTVSQRCKYHSRDHGRAQVWSFNSY